MFRRIPEPLNSHNGMRDRASARPRRRSPNVSFTKTRCRRVYFFVDTRIPVFIAIRTNASAADCMVSILTSLATSLTVMAAEHTDFSGLSTVYIPSFTSRYLQGDPAASLSLFRLAPA